MPFYTDERIKDGKRFQTWSHINLLSEHVTELEFQDRSSGNLEPQFSTRGQFCSPGTLGTGCLETFLVVPLGTGGLYWYLEGLLEDLQWLRLCTSSVRGVGLIPGWGTEIPYATWCSQKMK